MLEHVGGLVLKKQWSDTYGTGNGAIIFTGNEAS